MPLYQHVYYFVSGTYALDILKESSSSTVGREKCQLGQLSLGHKINENVTVYDHSCRKSECEGMLL